MEVVGELEEEVAVVVRVEEEGKKERKRAMPGDGALT